MSKDSHKPAEAPKPEGKPKPMEKPRDSRVDGKHFPGGMETK